MLSISKVESESEASGPPGPPSARWEAAKSQLQVPLPGRGGAVGGGFEALGGGDLDGADGVGWGEAGDAA